MDTTHQPTPTAEPSAPPATGWLPFDLTRAEEGARLEWRHIGETPLREPWFENSLNRHGRPPMSTYPPQRTPIEILDRPPPADPLPLAGIVFHASRCGSTLLGQLLGRSPRLSIFSEPPIIESLMEWSHQRDAATQARLAPRLAAALAHLRHRRIATEERAILKLESQHILDLPLFERLFPGVPWVFLYREPLAILHSQHRRRGRQMVPGMVAAERLGLDPAEIEPARLDDYCALQLQRTFEAAIHHLASGRGRAIHYRRLPRFAWEEADTLFGLGLDAGEIADMERQSRFDAKNPTLCFDGGNSRRAAPPAELERLAQGPLARLYDELERLER